MNDRELLKKIGLSEKELGDLLNKLHAFLGTLSRKQRQAFEKCLISYRQAAERLHEDVSPKELEAFIRERSPKGLSICIFHKVIDDDEDYSDTAG